MQYEDFGRDYPFLVIPRTEATRNLGFVGEGQEPRSLASLGMTTSGGAKKGRLIGNLVDLSFNDSGALPAIAFVGGSAVYLYI